MRDGDLLRRSFMAAALLVLVFLSACGDVLTVLAEGREVKQRGTVWGYFRPTKEEFRAGEPITVEMVVHNDGTEPFTFDKGGDYRFGNGRHERFFVSFGDTSVDYLSCGGGLMGRGTVAPKGVYREEIDLTPWGPPPPDDRGIVRVTCRRTLSSHVETRLLVDCLERKPLNHAREDARAALIGEMARLNRDRAGFAGERERQQEIERVVDLYLRFPQIQSTFDVKVNRRLGRGQGAGNDLP